MCLFLLPRPQLAPAIQSTIAFSQFLCRSDSSYLCITLSTSLHSFCLFLFLHPCLFHVVFGCLCCCWCYELFLLTASVFVLNSPCCCDDYYLLLQDSLTSHIFSFSPPSLPPKTTHGKSSFPCGLSIELNKMCLTDSR